MSEVLIPGLSVKAVAGEAIPEGRVFNWSATEGQVELCPNGDLALGVAIADIAEGELISPNGEWFKRGAIIRIVLGYQHHAGDYVESGANGTPQEITTGYPFAVCLQSGAADTEAELFIL